MEKMKPCPWCGETDKRRIVRPGLNGRYFVDHVDSVFNLKSSIGFNTEGEAVAAWNDMRFPVVTMEQHGSGGTVIGHVGSLTINR